MAQKISISAEKAECDATLTKALQSGHVNFLLGSGASLPAIRTAGEIETKLNELLDTDKDAFELEKRQFLSEIQEATNALIDKKKNKNNSATLKEYRAFLGNIARILGERKTDLLPKQVTIFTTNYDLFIERAAEGMHDLRVNDGFTRNPAVSDGYHFQPEHYFDVTFKTGALFRYRFPIPTVNLIKLHGSLSWRQSGDNLTYSAEPRSIPDPDSEDYDWDVPAFDDSFSLILPTKDKFSETLLSRVYYDLLRIFANTLEIENTVLICFGFSFGDEHIRDIVTRALKNPTLLILIISYDEASVVSYMEKFERHNNVLVVHPDGDDMINFSLLNDMLSALIPKSSP